MSNIHRNKYIRRSLLGMLNSIYPNGISLLALTGLLADVGFKLPQSEIEAHLEYLEIKDLVRIYQHQPSLGEIFAFLTVKGLDWMADANPDKNLGREDNDMSEGKTCQYIVGLDSPGNHVYAGAIVTADHGNDCCNLTVFPDNGISVYVAAEAFSKHELERGLARRTSVLKGETPGCWRDIPMTHPVPESENIKDNGGEAPGAGQDSV